MSNQQTNHCQWRLGQSNSANPTPRTNKNSRTYGSRLLVRYEYDNREQTTTIEAGFFNDAVSCLLGITYKDLVTAENNINPQNCEKYNH
ncbi:hypothetical protein QVD17_01861 [Tagetes erecta]|uniref:Uncharacterized protein n=1 Tax=Tagetes erecta TaxID=13708 RepID=A0AAD8LBD1_TARER|nr:hypothetical protein QVD17_01861 [Tagetes erecta]